jgi:hemerythrin superfamily protein
MKMFRVLALGSLTLEGGASMNALELLKNDHQKVSGFLEKLDQTTERAVKTRDETFAKLKEELEAHSHAEEEIFYPALRSESKPHDITLAAYEQHHVVKILLNELSDIPVDSEQWTAKFSVLKNSVEEHVKEEEGELFKAARAALSKEQLEELGTRMQADKQRQLDGQEAGAASGARSARSERAGYRATEGQRRARTESQCASSRFRCPFTMRVFFRLCG